MGGQRIQGQWIDGGSAQSREILVVFPIQNDTKKFKISKKMNHNFEWLVFLDDKALPFLLTASFIFHPFVTRH